MIICPTHMESAISAPNLASIMPYMPPESNLTPLRFKTLSLLPGEIIYFLRGSICTKSPWTQQSSSLAKYLAVETFPTTVATLKGQQHIRKSLCRDELPGSAIWHRFAFDALSAFEALMEDFIGRRGPDNHRFIRHGVDWRSQRLQQCPCHQRRCRAGHVSESPQHRTT